MDNDFNAPKAVAVVERFLAKCVKLSAKGQLGRKNAVSAMALLRKFDTVLACLPMQY
jgi:hypothetical protein